MELSTFKYRIYPNKKQIIQLQLINEAYWKTFMYLKEKTDANYEKHGFHMSITYLLKYVNSFLPDDLYILKRKTSVEIMQCSAYHLKSSLDKSKKIINKYSNVNGQINFILFNDNYSVDGKKISIPSLKNIKIRSEYMHNPEYKIKSLQIKSDYNGFYYALITCIVDEIKTVKIDIGKSLGLDFSLSHFYIDSNGNSPDFPFEDIEKLETKINFLKGINFKQEKGSNNYIKTRKKINRLIYRMTNIRTFFQINLAKELAKKYDIICVENLDVKDMALKFRNNAYNFNMNFGEKIYNLGYINFLKILNKKMNNNGKKLIKISRFYKSSQICSNCGYINDYSKDLKVRYLKCNKCGFECDRDKNAAINIKKEGICLYLQKEKHSIIK